MANEEQIEQLGVNLSVTGSEKFGPDLDAAAAAMKGFTAETKAMEKASPKFDAASKIIAASLKSINVASRGLDKSTASMNSFSTAMGNMSVNAAKMASSVNAAANAQSRQASANMKAASSAPNNDAHVKSWEEFQKQQRAMQGSRSRLGPTYGDRVDAGSAQTIRAIQAQIRLEEKEARKSMDLRRAVGNQKLLAIKQETLAQSAAAKAQSDIERVLNETKGRSAAFRKAKLQEVADAMRRTTDANIEQMRRERKAQATADAEANRAGAKQASERERIAAVASRLRTQAMKQAADLTRQTVSAKMDSTTESNLKAKIKEGLKADLASIERLADQTQSKFSEQALRDFRTFKLKLQDEARNLNDTISKSNFVKNQTDPLTLLAKGKQREKVFNLTGDERKLIFFEKLLQSNVKSIRDLAQGYLKIKTIASQMVLIWQKIGSVINVAVIGPINLILKPLRVIYSLMGAIFRLMGLVKGGADGAAKAADKAAAKAAAATQQSSAPRVARARSQISEDAAPARRLMGVLPARAQTVKIAADTSSATASIEKVGRATAKTRDEFGRFADTSRKTSAAVATIAPQAKEAQVQIIQVGVQAQQTSGFLSRLFFTISGSLATGFGIGIAQSLFRTGGNAIISTITGIKNAIGGMVSEAMSSISKTENIMVSLNSLMASELVMSGQFNDVASAEKEANKGAEEMYKWVTKLAIVSPFEKQDINSIVQMGMGFGISSDNVKALTQATVDWASASGKSSAEMDSVMRAIGQMSGAAVVAKEDLNQLRDAGLPAAAILAKMRGQTQGQFLQDVTDGAVKGTDAIMMLTQYMNNQFDGAAAKAGGTLSGLASSLRDIRSERLGQLFTPVTEGLVKPVLEMLVALAQAESVGQFFTDLGQRIQAFGSLVTGIGYSAFQIIQQFIQSIPAEAVTFITTFAKVAAVIVGIQAAFSGIGIAFMIFGAAIGLVLSPIALLVAAITGLHLAYKNALFGVREISGMAASAISALVASAIRWIAELYTNGGAYMNAFGQAVSDAVSWVIDTIWQLPQAFIDVMNQMESYGTNIIQMFADGIMAAGQMIVDALNYIGSIVAYWLTPGSPPKLLPDLTTWGTGAADAYLEGWKKADFDMLKDLGGLIEGAMGSISSDALPIEQITKIREAVAATIGSFNETGKFDDSGIRAVSGPFAETLSNISRAYLETASSARVMASAQEQLEKSTEFYTNALKPLQDRLKQIQGLQSNSGLDQEAIELNRVLQNTSATGAQKEAAKLRLEELNVQKEINALEGEQASKSESLQTQINAATKQNTLSQENLDILKERFSVQQGIQEGIQANVRAAIAEANAIKQQVEKDVVGKSDAEAEKMRREAEKNADAQLALNMQMADTPGKIALLKDKLAGLTEGSTEYLEVQKQIVSLEQKRENEIEAEAKALEAQGRKEEAAAKRAEAEARKQAKLQPGGELALGGGASLAMPAKFDFTSLTAKFEESSLKIKESFKKVTEGIEPITQGLENVKTKVDSVVKSFQDGFGGKSVATDGFSKMVEDMGAKAKILDTNLKIAATGIQKFSVDFKAAFDAKEGSFTQKFSAALDETGVIEKINSFKTNVLATVDGKSGGFVTTFTDAFKLEPGSLTDKFKAGLDETGVTTAIDGFKANLTKKLDGLAQSPLGAEIKAKIQIVLQSLTVENITEKLNDLKQNLIDGLSGFKFESAELETLRINLIEALTGMEISQEDVKGIGDRIVKGIALFFAAGPLVGLATKLLSGLVSGMGGGAAMFAGSAGAIAKGIGAALVSPWLWVPLGAIAIGAIVKSISDAFNSGTEGMSLNEKAKKLAGGMSDMASAAATWVGNMVKTVVDEIGKVDWLSAGGAAGFTIGAGIVKLGEAVAKILFEVPWGRLLKEAIEAIANILIGLVGGLIGGLLFGLYDTIASEGGNLLKGALDTMFGIVAGVITGALNVITGIVNLFTGAINKALPEGYEIGQIPKLVMDADLNIVTEEAIARTQTRLENAGLVVEAAMNMDATSDNIINQIRDSGLGPILAQHMNMQFNDAVTETDFSGMVANIQNKLGRELTAADMINLDPLLDEMDYEFERVALAISQSENASEIVTKINEKLNTDFAATDFTGAGEALLQNMNDGLGPGLDFEFTGLNSMFEQVGIDVEAKAKEVGSKASKSLAEGMKGASQETGNRKGEEAGGLGAFAGSDMKATGAQMATDLAAGVDEGLAANTDLGLSFWEAAKADWKSFWGIQSPSTVAHDEFGMPIGEGVLGGVTAALEAAPDPLGVLRTTIETSLTTILASISTFGAAATAQFVVLKQSLTTTSIEQATAMKNLYAALFKDLLAKQIAFRLAIVKDTRLMYDDVKKIFVELSDDLKALMQALYEEILRIVTNIRTESVAQFSTMKDEMVGVIEDMNEAIGEELDKLPGIFEEKLQAAIDVISSDTIADQFIKAGKDLGLVFLDAIADGLADSTALKRIDDAIESIVSNMEDALVAALDQLADAVANAAPTPATGGGATPPGSTPGGGRSNGIPQGVSNVANQVLNNVLGASNDIASRIVDRTGQQVTTGVQTGRTQQVIAPVNNSKTYILQMQVTPSQVERVSNNYAIFEAMTG